MTREPSKSAARTNSAVVLGGRCLDPAQRGLVCIISQHDNNVLLGTQSLKLSAFTHMFAFDPGKPGIIKRSGEISDSPQDIQTVG